MKGLVGLSKCEWITCPRLLRVNQVTPPGSEPGSPDPENRCTNHSATAYHYDSNYQQVINTKEITKIWVSNSRCRYPTHSVPGYSLFQRVNGRSAYFDVKYLEQSMGQFAWLKTTRLFRRTFWRREKSDGPSSPPECVFHHSHTRKVFPCVKTRRFHLNRLSSTLI